jgi:hypothetical protein
MDKERENSEELDEAANAPDTHTLHLPPPYILLD